MKARGAAGRRRGGFSKSGGDVALVARYVSIPPNAFRSKLHAPAGSSISGKKSESGPSSDGPEAAQRFEDFRRTELDVLSARPRGLSSGWRNEYAQLRK